MKSILLALLFLTVPGSWGFAVTNAMRFPERQAAFWGLLLEGHLDEGESVSGLDPIVYADLVSDSYAGDLPFSSHYLIMDMMTDVEHPQSRTADWILRAVGEAARRGVPPARIKLMAGYPKTARYLAQSYFATGDLATLRLFAWVLDSAANIPLDFFAPEINTVRAEPFIAEIAAKHSATAGARTNEKNLLFILLGSEGFVELPVKLGNPEWENTAVAQRALHRSALVRRLHNLLSSESVVGLDLIDNLQVLTATNSYLMWWDLLVETSFAHVIGMAAAIQTDWLALHLSIRATTLYAHLKGPASRCKAGKGPFVL